jgi:hypothetical protein
MGKPGRQKKYTPETIEKEAEALDAWSKNPKNFWLKDFALERDYGPQRLTEMAKDNENFAKALDRAKSRQESRLFKGGLVNTFNASLVKFALVNHHGWRDRDEEELNQYKEILIKIDPSRKRNGDSITDVSRAETTDTDN